MKNISKILCVVSVFLLSSCDYVFPSTWNYRITVEIETPEGIKTGSAVREVRAWKELATFINPDARSSLHQIIGEAVVVNLDEHGVLFVLIGSHEEVYEALPSNKKTWSETFQYYRNIKLGTKAELVKRRPTMVMFSDLTNPKTIKLVYREKWVGAGKDYKVIDHFEDILGKGVSLKRITIEMTDAPVTWGIEMLLPWLPGRKYVPGYIGGSSDFPFTDPSETYLKGTELSVGKFWK